MIELQVSCRDVWPVVELLGHLDDLAQCLRANSRPCLQSAIDGADRYLESRGDLLDPSWLGPLVALAGDFI
jgi:hypothetical protein